MLSLPGSSRAELEPDHPDSANQGPPARPKIPDKIPSWGNHARTEGPPRRARSHPTAPPSRRRRRLKHGEPWSGIRCAQRKDELTTSTIPRTINERATGTAEPRLHVACDELTSVKLRLGANIGTPHSHDSNICDHM
ncbi:hypothetical protein K3495_g8449 [Podosphaera aphanis]|nr:hypothetical protein K3495_g8449 [Podosphaera aphanis]